MARSFHVGRSGALVVCVLGVVAAAGCKRDKVGGDDGPARTDCRSVLVYSTESGGGSGRDHYLGIFSKLDTNPDLAGFTIDVVERAGGGRLTAEKLEGRSQVWFMGTDRDFDTEPTDAEVEAIDAFVAAGGGLLLAADHTDANYAYADDVDAIAQGYGVTFGGSHDESGASEGRSPEGPSGPLMTDVATLPAFATVADLTVDDDVSVAFAFDGLPAAAWRDGDARVVFDRSWLGWSDYHSDEFDQQRYIANVAAFLEPCG